MNKNRRYKLIEVSDSWLKTFQFIKGLVSKKSGKYSNSLKEKKLGLFTLFLL